MDLVEVAARSLVKALGFEPDQLWHHPDYPNLDAPAWKHYEHEAKELLADLAEASPRLRDAILDP